MSGNSKVLLPPASVDNETCQRCTVPSEDVEAKSAEDADSGYTAMHVTAFSSTANTCRADLYW
jgi:hypothetical protein